MISICSQQCNYSMKRQRFYCFISFAQKRGCSSEWKTAKLHRGPKMGSQLFVQWTTQYFSLCQDCHHIPEAFCLQHRDQRISPIISNNWEHYQIQCRLEVTSMHAGNRCWQIMTCRPWGTVNQTRWTRKIHRKAFLFGCRLSQWIQRIWRRMCSHIPLKEWSQIRKLQKWRHKNRSTVFMLTSAKTKRDLLCEQKSMVTWQQQSTKSSTKDVNLGTITDTLSWYTFSPLSGIRVKPKLHRRRRRIYERSYSRRRSQKLFICAIH